jgi:hypothetical protein
MSDRRSEAAAEWAAPAFDRTLRLQREHLLRAVRSASKGAVRFPEGDVCDVVRRDSGHAANLAETAKLAQGEEALDILLAEVNFECDLLKSRVALRRSVSGSLLDAPASPPPPWGWPAPPFGGAS